MACPVASFTTSPPGIRSAVQDGGIGGVIGTLKLRVGWRLLLDGVNQRR